MFQNPPGKLIADNAPESGSQNGVSEGRLEESSDKEVDIVNVSVEPLEKVDMARGDKVTEIVPISCAPGSNATDLPVCIVA